MRRAILGTSEALGGGRENAGKEPAAARRDEKLEFSIAPNREVDSGSTAKRQPCSVLAVDKKATGVLSRVSVEAVSTALRQWVEEMRGKVAALSKMEADRERRLIHCRVALAEMACRVARVRDSRTRIGSARLQWREEQE